MKEELIESVDKEELNQLAQQLRCPKGEKGIFIGELLSDTNKGMVLESVKLLDVQDKDRVLELGHGNASHLPDVLKQASELKYFGMEISEIMQQQAVKINAKYIKKRVALFLLYNGLNIPYVVNFFHKIITVNTIYFWTNPIDFLTEIHRVLKSNGVFVVSFANSSFMKQLPFVANTNVFSLYDHETFINLIAETDFKLVKIKNKTETVKSKTGEWVSREYSIAVLRKN
ncbi:class I SAM-dependent methyltransferase [Polaribacter sp. HaHaR_3_91]|uniref:class I SAM-dependent methyltransferase n=1 Tax=Polaribacter sp. HaHaR_3_91 TaxID=2745561 RepID=UPI001C4F1561|nr:methyltransferase domain-containing protein [Polaribacter sp. HaHaR_3_91]QXP65036.1 methyltransferase domain-containing protein [Polaribacter sp. HaHaR_3_91]